MTPEAVLHVPSARQGHDPGIAYRLPDSLAVGLAVQEVTLAARRKHTDTKALEDGIANVQSLLVRFEGSDPLLRKVFFRHSVLSNSSCTGGTETT